MAGDHGDISGTSVSGPSTGPQSSGRVIEFRLNEISNYVDLWSV